MLQEAVLLIGILLFLLLIYVVFCRSDGFANERQNYLYSSYWREQAEKKRNKRKKKK